MSFFLKNFLGSSISDSAEKFITTVKHGIKNVNGKSSAMTTISYGGTLPSMVPLLRKES